MRQLIFITIMAWVVGIILPSLLPTNLSTFIPPICQQAVAAEPESESVVDRVPWTTSRIQGSPDAPRPFVLERTFANVQFTKSVELVYEKTTDRYFIIEVGGRISSMPSAIADAKIKENTNSKASAKTDLVIDLKKHYPALIHTFGIAFHPNFKSNNYVYVVYVPKRKSPGGTHLSRFTVTQSKAGSPVIDVASEQLLLTWRSGGHNGGKLLFGRDGMLYISTGDGGVASPPDQYKTGQDISDLLSSVLRIDVNKSEGGKAYGIPADNPFVDHPDARPEVWAYGLRNPWKMSFDQKTGDLWVGDVGWELWEMIFKVRRGGNYGWSIVEGSQVVQPNGKRGPTPIQSAVVEHPHTEAKSITGGYVYRGKRLTALQGKYVYGDYITGKVWSIPTGKSGSVKPTEIADTSINLISFAESSDGDLLLLDYGGGVYRLKPNPALKAVRNPNAFPTRLSETGLFSSVKIHKPARGVVAYDVNAGLWSGYATSERLIALPSDSKIDVYTKRITSLGQFSGTWKFPAGTVFARTYSMEMKRGAPASRKRLETQVLHLDGAKWRGYSYVWNDAQTDATLAPPSGLDRNLKVADADAGTDTPGVMRNQVWHTAGQSECMMCHNERSGSVLGFVPQQLHQLTGKSELKRLRSMGLFTDTAQADLPHRPMAQLNREDEKGHALTNRARTWLHVNCAHCHQLGGGGSTPMDLRFQTPYVKTRLIGMLPLQGDFGLPHAKVVAMGKPLSSVLLYRIATTGVGHMPRMGSQFVDKRGVRLIHKWIAQGNQGEGNGADSGDADKRSDADDVLKSATFKQLASMLDSTDGALRLVLGLDSITDVKLRKRIISKGAGHADVRVAGLFERFIPANQRRKTLGTDVNPALILSLKGNAARGKRMMTRGGAVTCYSCHQVGADNKDTRKGVALGPNLAAIGSKYSRSEILLHILEPSKVVEEKYVTWMVQLADGDDLTGFIVSRDKKRIALKLLTGTEQVIAVEDVEQLRKLKLSAMPQHLLQGLTAQEAADLLAYLAGLKKKP